MDTKRRQELNNAREEAAKKRKKIAGKCNSGTYQPSNVSKGEEKAMAGRTTTLSIKKPTDWRFVTPSTLHNYVPFERSDVNQGIVFKLITTELAKHPKPTSTYKNKDHDLIPLWYLSKKQLRKTIYKAAFRRTDEAKLHEWLTMFNDLKPGIPL